MEAKLEREVRFLKAYAVIATLACVLAFVLTFVLQNRRQKFGEIDVERINVVEPDGKLRMVISDQKRQHPGIVNGKVIPRTEPRPPGMIFFNQMGDEMGGLIFGDNGGKGHFGMLTFDKVQNDQAIGFSYLESDNGSYSTGLELWQQPNLPSDVVNEKYKAASQLTDTMTRNAAFQKMSDDGELTTRRLFLGKGRDNTVALTLADIKGRPRIKVMVTAEGMATFNFLDESGKVVCSLPGVPGAGGK